MIDTQQSPAGSAGQNEKPEGDTLLINSSKDSEFKADKQTPLLSFESLKADAERLSNEVVTPDSILTDNKHDASTHPFGFFRVNTAYNDLMEANKEPIPRDLYFGLMNEGEITILFADTGIGKSIFAYQMAEYISKTDKVLYLDLELSKKQFEKRYSNDYREHYHFNSNFLRVEFQRPFFVPNGVSYDDYFMQSLVSLIDGTGAKIVIVDNMTRLISGDTDKAQSAKPLMDKLNNLKFEKELSLLLLEHNKKTDPHRPIQLTDLQGSKMKTNFADAIFSIGRNSFDPNQRYVVQLKCRTDEAIYNRENVSVYDVVKENSFLHFKYNKSCAEVELVKEQTEKDIEDRNLEIVSLKNQGLSGRKIAEKVGISEKRVRDILKKYEDNK